MPAVRQNIERYALRAGGRLEALQTYDPSEIGSKSQMEHRAGLAHVRFTPNSDRLLHGSKMTLCANTDQSAVQQTGPLLDDLVGGDAQTLRHGKTQCLRRP